MSALEKTKEAAYVLIMENMSTNFGPEPLKSQKNGGLYCIQ